MIETNPDATAIAEELDREREAGQQRSPIHGLPILLKDNIATADGNTTTAGSFGLTEVFFDGTAQPTMTSTDRTIRWGRLGVGSFDDTARFRRLRVWAPATKKAEGSPFE